MAEQVRRGLSFRVFRWVFVCSGTALAGLLSTKGALLWVVAGIPLAALTLAVMTFRYDFLERVFARFSLWRAAVSLLLAAYAANVYGNLFQIHLLSLAAEMANPTLSSYVERFGGLFCLAAGAASVPALFVYLNWFLGWFSARMRGIFRSMDTVERWFLPLAFALFATLIVAVYSNTDAFHSPNIHSENLWDTLDIVYSSDSCQLTKQNVFFNIGAQQNDIRQPLFGAFAAPFALGVSLLSRLLALPQAYVTLLQLLQALLLLVSLLLIARMIGVTGTAKALTLACLAVLYPTLLYLLNVEQYIFAVFWLILLVYLITNGETRPDSAWAAATGSMLTSGALLLLVPERGGARVWFRQAARTVLQFGVMMVLLGRTGMVFSVSQSIPYLLQFSGVKLSFLARLMQYVQFAASCLVAPAAQTEFYTNGIAVFHQVVVDRWSILGFVCILAALGGFLANRKRLYAQICAGWVALSFILLCVLGWGTAEHALVLYTHYFAWAFVSLIVMLIVRVFRRHRVLQLAVLSAGVLALAVVNARGLSELIRFGLTYYPLG